MQNKGWSWLLFGFDGRIGRSRFWAGYVVVIAVIVVATAASVSIELSSGTLLYVIAFVLAFWPSLALYMKRFHDRGKSGWWVLISLIPIVGQIWLTVELGFFRGDSGSNTYGPDPLT